MKSWERRIAPLGFFLAGVLFLVAAFIPVMKGQPFNVAFLGPGVVFAILGAVLWRKSGESNPPPV